jgi:hypothetical protein
MRLLKGGDHREGRLGALVLISSTPFQTVTSAATYRVVERGAGVVLAEEPTGATGDSLAPSRVAGDLQSTGYGVSHRSHLDGLLIEPWSRFASSPSTHGYHGQSGRATLDVVEPAEHCQPVAKDGGVAQEIARSQQDFSKGGIRVARSSANPRPCRAIR